MLEVAKRAPNQVGVPYGPTQLDGLWRSKFKFSHVSISMSKLSMEPHRGSARVPPHEIVAT